MTPEILTWLAEVVSPLSGSFGKVFEIGSLNINGSVRSVLQPKSSEWIGCDRRNGKDVDLVADAGDILENCRGEFDTIVASSSLEHDPFFWIANEAAKAALREGGFYVVTVPAIGFPFHDYGGDFYRFTEMAVRDALFHQLSVIDVRTVGEVNDQNVVGVAQKPRKAL